MVVTAWHRNLIGLLLVASVSVAMLGKNFLSPVAALDEGILLVHPDLINRGLIPNRDFCSLYPPGNYWFLALVYRAFVTDIIVERLVGFFYICGIFSAIFFLANRRDFSMALIAAVMVSFVLQWLPAPMAAYSWFGGVALASWSVVLGSQRPFAPYIELGHEE